MQEQIIGHRIYSGVMQVLSVQQLYKICTQYWDDKYNTESVSEEVSGGSLILSCSKDNDESYPSLCTKCVSYLYNKKQFHCSSVYPYFPKHPKLLKFPLCHLILDNRTQHNLHIPFLFCMEKSIQVKIALRHEQHSHKNTFYIYTATRSSRSTLI